MQFSVFLYLVIIDLPNALQVGLVARYRQKNALWSMILELTHPFFHLFEAFPGGNFVCDDGSEGFSIVDWSDGVILFLSGRILGVK